MTTEAPADNLAARMRASGSASPMETGAVRRLARDLATALTRAHDAGLVHGHLTCERVVFDEDGTAQLSGLRATPPTPADGAPKPSAFEDQRAMAAVLYQALTGKTPDQTEGRQVADQRPDVPRALDTVLARGLAHEPSARYPDVFSFARAFEAAFEKLASPSKTTLALAMLGPLAVVAVGILWAMSGSSDEPRKKPPAKPAPLSAPAVDAGR